MRKEIVEAKNKQDAQRLAPWAAKLQKVVGGYMAFESISDYQVWKNQK